MRGVFLKTTDNYIVKIASIAKLDFVIIDLEHGISSLKDVKNHILSSTRSTKVYVRVNNPNSENITQITELSPDGLVIPNIQDYNQWKELKSRLYFYPKGKRGVCRFVPAANFGELDSKKYFTQENDQKHIVQIEGGKALDQIEMFLNDDDISTIFIGPYDLSQHFGVPGEIFHPKVIQCIERITKLGKINNKGLGIFVDNSTLIKKFELLGFNFIACSVDYNLLLEAFKEIKEQ